MLLPEYLEHVWAAISREALSMIFSDADTAGLEEDARLTAMWLWTLSTGTVSATDGPLVTHLDDDVGDGEASAGPTSNAPGFSLEYDAARKIAQGLGAYLDRLTHLVEVKGETARLLAVTERVGYLFGREEARAPSVRKGKSKQLDMFAELAGAEEETAWGISGTPPPGRTILDRVHQAMILFGTGRSEALRRFLVDQRVGDDAAFWRLAQSLSALYPPGIDEKRWVDGLLGRKRGLRF